jgi:hypothetical protein
MNVNYFILIKRKFIFWGFVWLRIGTSNEAALETVLNAIAEDIDKLIALDVPQPTKEITTAVECLVFEVHNSLIHFF